MKCVFMLSVVTLAAGSLLRIIGERIARLDKYLIIVRLEIQMDISGHIYTKPLRLHHGTCFCSAIAPNCTLMARHCL